MSTTKVGQRVLIKGKEDEYGEGTVKFVGIVKFDSGKWVGIELDKPCTLLNRVSNFLLFNIGKHINVYILMIFSWKT